MNTNRYIKLGVKTLGSLMSSTFLMDLSVGYTKTEPVLGDVVKKALASISEDRREEMLVEAILAPYLDPRAAE